MRLASLLALSLSLLAADLSGASQDEEIVLGKPSPIRSASADDEIDTFAAGTRLRQAPSFDAPILEVLEVSVDLPVVDRRDEWLKVQFGTRLAWVHPTADRDLEGQRPPATFAPDDARLWRARAVLEEGIEPRALGPLTLYTDVDDPSLLDWLSSVAWGVLQAFDDRFMLDPGIPDQEIVILFAREADYRDFEAAEERLVDTDSRGYTSEGLSILFLGDQDRTGLASIFVHELTHLLSRRVFRTTLPPWLEEGLAEDLAFCVVTDRGTLRLGTLAGRSPRDIDDATAVSGAKAQLAALVAAWQGADRPELEALLAMPWEEFVEPSRRGLHYTTSAMFVRLLLDGDSAELAAAFRSFLADLAAADPGPWISPWEVLPLTPSTASEALVRFTVGQARANGIR
jgi:hypothetical protein